MKNNPDWTQSSNWKQMLKTFVGVLIVLLLLTAVAPQPVAAGLPPRPEVPDRSSSSSPVKGGFIELSVDALQPGLWTQVQWLAGDGNWYDVDGWHGHFTSDDVVLWYVGQELLGDQASFRWQVYDGEGGPLLATSEPFLMPERRAQTVQVSITLSG